MWKWASSTITTNILWHNHSGHTNRIHFGSSFYNRWFFFFSEKWCKIRGIVINIFSACSPSRTAAPIEWNNYSRQYHVHRPYSCGNNAELIIANLGNECSGRKSVEIRWETVRNLYSGQIARYARQQLGSVDRYILYYTPHPFIDY